METVPKVLVGIVFVFCFCGVLLWRHFGADICLPVLADMTPILLAVAGVIMSYIQPKKESHVITTIVLIVAGLLGSAVLTINRIKSEATHRAEIATLNDKMDIVRNQNANLSNFLIASKNTGMSEADRKKAIETTLRNQYILSHDPIDPDILAGTKMPPEDWMNKRLGELGETWTISQSKPAVTATAPPPRSYIVLDGNPRFTGPNAAGAEGADFVVGSQVAFNIHFKNTGPNSLELGEQAMAAYLKDDYAPKTQEALQAEFKNEVNREKQSKRPMSSLPHIYTMGPGTAEWFTAVSWTDTLERVLFTQNDLDSLKTGGKIAFVIAEITYKDAGTQHHFRTCMWLVPPATANGIWHFCDVFNDSD